MEVWIAVPVLLLGALLGWIVFRKKPPMSYQEWAEIYWAGFNEGVNGAANFMDDCASLDPAESRTHKRAELIRQLAHTPVEVSR